MIVLFTQETVLKIPHLVLLTIIVGTSQVLRLHVVRRVWSWVVLLMVLLGRGIRNRLVLLVMSNNIFRTKDLLLRKRSAVGQIGQLEVCFGENVEELVILPALV